MSENLYSWEFEDKKERWTLWYVIALSVAIWICIWWFFTKQYGMSFIVLLVSWLFYFVENNSEDMVKVLISQLWITIAGTFYDFWSIVSYWIVYNKQDPILLRLNLKKRWIKNIDVKINSLNIIEIKNILSEFLEETQKIELSLPEKIINLLKL